MNSNSSSTSAEQSTSSFHFTAGVILFLISFYGVIVNGYVFKCFLSSKRFRSDFYIFCISKSTYNFITCFVFFIWASPCTLLGFFYLSYSFNLIFGQLALFGYLSGILTQVVVSVNRFCVTYWPMRGGRMREKYGLYIGLCFVWAISGTRTILALPANCGYYYDIEQLSWEIELTPCSKAIAMKLLYIVFYGTAFSNTLNILTFGKLCYDTKKSLIKLSSKQNATRQRKRIQMFAQSCTQDLLYVFDMTTGYWISRLSEELWFSFMTRCVSFLFVHVLDGTIMVAFNKELHPTTKKKETRTVSTTANSQRTNN